MITMLSITTMMTISLIIMMITLTINFKSITDQEKLSPFECGFNPMSSPRIPFSTRFFMIAMIFLIFDVEIILLLPMPSINLNLHTTIATSSLFIMILILGLFHEWHKGALNWAE